MAEGSEDTSPLLPHGSFSSAENASSSPLLPCSHAAAYTSAGSLLPDVCYALLLPTWRALMLLLWPRPASSDGRQEELLRPGMMCLCLCLAVSECVS